MWKETIGVTGHTYLLMKTCLDIKSVGVFQQIGQLMDLLSSFLAF